MEDKIKSSKLNKEPFSSLIIENFISNKDYDNIINKEWPSNKIFENDDIYTQKIANINKKIIVTDTNTWKELMNNSPTFKKLYDFFSNIEIYKILCNKFKVDIYKELNIDPTKIIPKVKLDISICNSDYDCKTHCDRREHIFSILIYPDLESNNESYLNLHKNNNKNNKIYDVFPDTLEISKRIRSSGNKAIFFLNVPYAYHSVDGYKSTKKHKRRFIYVSYDFKDIKKNEGNNNSEIWKSKTKVFSEKRRNIFLGKE
jgi:hypothetical protein